MLSFIFLSNIYWAQLYSRHCLKLWEHEHESTRVPPVSELSAEETIPTVKL